MKTRQPALVLGCLVALGSLPPSIVAQRAHAQPSAASSAQVDALIEDIKAHKQMCDKVDSSQVAVVHQCANEKAALVARQKRLGVSDATLNGKLKTRGWRWP